jgi:hypothetical protein
MARWAISVSSMMGLLLFSAGGCQSKPAQPEKPAAPQEHRPATRPMGEHWIQDERLREVMAELNRQMRESYPTGLPDDVESKSPPLQRAFAQAATLADGLARAANRIPNAIRDKRISDDDRRGFLEEAATLRTHAEKLKFAAEEHQLEPMQRSLLGINATCIACHSKYKDISGEINFPKAAASSNTPVAAVR